MTFVRVQRPFPIELCHTGDMMHANNLYIVECFLRCFAGVLFFFQGYDKLFRIKLNAVVDAFMADAARYNVPRVVVSAVTFCTSFIEFAGGILLVAGLFTPLALYALCLDLLIVCFAFSVVEPMWDMKHLFPRLLLVSLLLLLPKDSQRLGLDFLFNLNN